MNHYRDSFIPAQWTIEQGAALLTPRERWKRFHRWRRVLRRNPFKKYPRTQKNETLLDLSAIGLI